MSLVRMKNMRDKENDVTEESDAAKMQCQCISDWGSMSERPLVDHTADTIQFQRVDDRTSRRRAHVSSAGSDDTSSEQLRLPAGRSSSKRIVFKERSGPDLWLISAIVALAAAVAVFVGGVVVNQARDSTSTYQSVYVPANVLGGAQK